MSVEATLDETIDQINGIYRKRAEALTTYHKNLRELKELLQGRLIKHEDYARDRKVVMCEYAKTIQQLLVRERILKHKLDVTSAVATPRSNVTFRQYELALN